VRVRLDSWAWAETSAFTPEQLESLKQHLTIESRADDTTGRQTILLYREIPGWIGVPREYYLPKRKPLHEIEDATAPPNHAAWPGGVSYTTTKPLWAEQAEALQVVTDFLATGPRGGLLRAPPGWGKSAWSCALIDRLRVPALVIVHKEFLLNQWRKRLVEYLPGVQIGLAQGDTCDYRGKHVVLGMVQSLSSRRYEREFYRHFGLLLIDECHRVGAKEWSPVPGVFPTRWRVGLSATPRRKDGAENVFRYHLGQELFAAKEKSLPFKVRFVYSDFYLVKPGNGTAGRSFAIDYLTQSESRNRQIAHELDAAVTAGRKILVVSERLAHLAAVDAALRDRWTNAPGKGPLPSIGYFVGGRSEEQLDAASECQVVFATTQLVLEGLDIAALDTLFLLTPLADIEQAVGRIQRYCVGKKQPVVVDIRDDRVPACRTSADARMRFYRRNNAA
jgi:hypothetical protein